MFVFQSRTSVNFYLFFFFLLLQQMERFIDSNTNQHLRHRRNGQTTDGRLRVKTNSPLYHGEYFIRCNFFIFFYSFLSVDIRNRETRFINRDDLFSFFLSGLPPAPSTTIQPFHMFYYYTIGRSFLVFNVLIIPFVRYSLRVGVLYFFFF